LDECTCPELRAKPNPVNGERPMTFCTIARDFEIYCGKNGIYWKSKDAPETESNIEYSWLSKIFNIFK
jgi:hypothetical protein